MLNLEHLHPQYLKDNTGKNLFVMLPIQEFEELLEDFHDLAILAQRRDEETISHQDLVWELKQDGLI
jgi:hypothetical protein